ncbi:MAG: hypothetical protein IKA72_00300 [Clostridia bacterium]|nr:hypothetical protein [Clostridia bacterium]
MKKILSLFLSIFFSIICFVSCGCPRERSLYDAPKIAIEEFGAEEIIVMTYSRSAYSWLSDAYGVSDLHEWYVFAKKDGKEILVIVPSNTDKQPVLAEWPLDYSFEEIKTALQEFFGIKLEYFAPDYGFDDFQIIFGEEKIKNCLSSYYGINEPLDIDKEIMIVCKPDLYNCQEHFVIQSNGELKIFTYSMDEIK